MSQAQVMAARPLTPSASAPAQVAPFGAGGSVPQITLSPSARATGRATTGFLFLVMADTCTTLTVHMRDPHTLAWGEIASFDVPNDTLAPFKWITVCGVNACELWFETNAASDESDYGPLVLVAETSGG